MSLWRSDKFLLTLCVIKELDVIVSLSWMKLTPDNSKSECRNFAIVTAFASVMQTWWHHVSSWNKALNLLHCVKKICGVMAYMGFETSTEFLLTAHISICKSPLPILCIWVFHVWLLASNTCIRRTEDKEARMLRHILSSLHILSPTTNCASARATICRHLHILAPTTKCAGTTKCGATHGSNTKCAPNYRAKFW